MPAASPRSPLILIFAAFALVACTDPTDSTPANPIGTPETAPRFDPVTVKSFGIGGGGGALSSASKSLKARLEVRRREILLEDLPMVHEKFLKSYRELKKGETSPEIFALQIAQEGHIVARYFFEEVLSDDSVMGALTPIFDVVSQMPQDLEIEFLWRALNRPDSLGSVCEERFLAIYDPSLLPHYMERIESGEPIPYRIIDVLPILVEDDDLTLINSRVNARRESSLPLVAFMASCPLLTSNPIALDTVRTKVDGFLISPQTYEQALQLLRRAANPIFIDRVEEICKTTENDSVFALACEVLQRFRQTRSLGVLIPHLTNASPWRSTPAKRAVEHIAIEQPPLGVEWAEWWANHAHQIDQLDESLQRIIDLRVQLEERQKLISDLRWLRDERFETCLMSIVESATGPLQSIAIEFLALRKVERAGPVLLRIMGSVDLNTVRTIETALLRIYGKSTAVKMDLWKRLSESQRR